MAASLSMPAVVAGVLALASGPMAALAADPVAEFYKGKQVSMIIGNPPGGGYDAYSRLLTRSMGKHIPGNPSMVPKNMPGAGGSKALSFIYKLAAKDGTVMGNAQPPSLMEPLLRLSDKKVDYDPVKFQYLGSANSEASLCVLRKDAAVKSFKDVLTTEAIVGGSGSSTIDYPLTHNAVLGTKFKVIAGFKGTRDLSLAMKRGEVQGLCGLFWSSLNTLFPDWRTAGEINIIVQEATKGEPELLKMGVPTVYDFAKEAEQRQAMDLMYKPLVFGRPFVMPPETPADRLAALRTAFDKVMKDPDLLADAKKLRIPIQPTTGAEVQELVKALYAIPTGVVDKLRKELIAQRK